MRRGDVAGGGAVYEHDPQRLVAALATVRTDAPVRLWTPANAEHLTIQALALLAGAGVPLSTGDLEDLVSVRVPPAAEARATEFCPWTNEEAQDRVVQGARDNLGEMRLGYNLNVSALRRLHPSLSPNQQRRFQLRGVIHELFHALDFGDVLRVARGDRDAAIRFQGRHIGFGPHLAGYARNEIETDARAGAVLDRAGLLFPELRRSLAEYRADWEAQGPVSEQAFTAICGLLGRSPFP